MPEVELTGRAAPLYRWLDWPLRLALVTLLWCLGVAAGLVLAGLAPATIAAHKVIADYRDEPEAHPWKAFWSSWREWLGRGQLVLGVPLATVWVLAFYLVAARQTVWAVPLSVVLLGYLVTLWLLAPVLLTAGSRRTTEPSPRCSWRRSALGTSYRLLWCSGLRQRPWPPYWSAHGG
jgi:uncharacterized membrane protein YesL